MEYRDLYDENRKLTGEKIKKGDIVPNNRYYITVAVWIENTNAEFLLQINKKYNKWAPTGGHPKSGESSREGIIIEIKEEIGIDVNKEELKNLGVQGISKTSQKITLVVGNELALDIEKQFNGSN